MKNNLVKSIAILFLEIYPVSNPLHVRSDTYTGLFIDNSKISAVIKMSCIIKTTTSVCAQNKISQSGVKEK